MNTPTGFSAQVRRRALRASLRSDLWGCLFATLLAAWGLYFLLGLNSDAAEHRLGSLLIGAAMDAGAVFWVRSILRGARARRAPGGDPLSVQLKAYGQPEVLAAEIDADFAGERFTTKRIFLGRRWVCHMEGKELILRRLESLVWAYPEAVKHKLNGVIPLWTTHQLMLWDREGRGAAMIGKAPAVQEALRKLGESEPWLFLGYSEALKESWNNDREDLLADLDRRRAQAR